MVNVVIVDFRGFDTMGEITVLSIAGLGVYGLARLARRESRELPFLLALAGDAHEGRAGLMRRSLILDVIVQVVFHSALMLGLFLLFTGHNRPGGGFVGGLVVGAGLSLRYIGGGIDEIRRTVPIRPWTILGTGLLLSASTTVFPMFAGRSLMEHWKFDLHLPLYGDVHVNTALFFDIGVAFVVIGTVLHAARRVRRADAEREQPVRAIARRPMSLLMALSTALLFSTGTYLLLQRRLSRLIIGLGLIGHGANLLLLLSGGERGIAPIIGSTGTSRVADPMPPALALDGDRDLVRRLGFPARAGVPELAAHRERPRRGRSRGPSDRSHASRRRGRRGDERPGSLDGVVRGREVGPMMRVLLPLPVIISLIGAGASMACARQRMIQRAISVISLGTALGASIAILVHVDRDGPAATFMGGWRAPVGIALVADRLTSIMIVIAALVLLAVLTFAMGQPGTEQEQPSFHPVYLVLAAGVFLSFLTGDLFNMFVAFEMMLTASYILITLGGRLDQVRSGMTYVVINLVASTFFVVLLGLLYASLGTVNLADLSERMHTIPSGVRVALALLLFVVFGIKAAVFPLFFWLPDSYPTAPTAITAIFAGLLTKVGVYCLIRTQTLLVAPGDRISGFILTIAALTMVIGVLGAIAQNDIKRILSFHIVSQIGYMILGLGLFTVAGIGAAIFYAVNQIVLKSTLLLVGGLVDHSAGSSGLTKVGGIARRFPVLGWLFLIPALSLAGVPPFAGFVAKLAVIQSGLRRRPGPGRRRESGGQRAHALLDVEDLGWGVLG